MYLFKKRKKKKAAAKRETVTFRDAGHKDNQTATLSWM